MQLTKEESQTPKGVSLFGPPCTSCAWLDKWLGKFNTGLPFMTRYTCHLCPCQCMNSVLIAYSATTVHEGPSATVFACEYFIDTRLGKLLTSTHHYKQRTRARLAHKPLLLLMMMMMMTAKCIGWWMIFGTLKY